MRTDFALDLDSGSFPPPVNNSPQPTPRFLQGVYPFAGRGVYESTPLGDDLSYTVPAGHVAQVIYVRAGNFSDDILYITLSVDGTAVRYFPVGPKSDIHVPLAIREDHSAESRIEICLGAPRGLAGSIVVDIGVLEYPRVEAIQ